ncbi:MAG: hypothetical protein GX683_00020 [Ruminococcaceae bacterium]|nr:hypothetical protein [Oscillospiraceae bacterium]
MKGFFKAIASLTVFATALAALVYFLNKLGLISIEYSADEPLLKTKEIDFARGKTVFRSSDHLGRRENTAAAPETLEPPPAAFDFQFADAE